MGFLHLAHFPIQKSRFENFICPATIFHENHCATVSRVLQKGRELRLILEVPGGPLGASGRLSFYPEMPANMANPRPVWARAESLKLRKTSRNRRRHLSSLTVAPTALRSRRDLHANFRVRVLGGSAPRVRFAGPEGHPNAFLCSGIGSSAMAPFRWHPRAGYPICFMAAGSSTVGRVFEVLYVSSTPPNLRTGPSRVRCSGGERECPGRAGFGSGDGLWSSVRTTP